MKIVYLDQNKWIELARSREGIGGGGEIGEVAEVMKAASRLRQAKFPLSFAHYVETTKARAATRRRKLASVMLDLSEGFTLSPPDHMLRFEIDRQLFALFPSRIEPRRMQPLHLLGRGVRHATGFRELGLPKTNELIEMFAPDVATDLRLKGLAEKHLEFVALSRLLSDGRDASEPTPLSPERKFKEGLIDQRKQWDQFNAVDRERFLYSMALNDILPVLEEALSAHSLSLDEFALLGEQGWCRFLDEIPASRIDIHLHRQWMKNRSLRPRLSDGNDFAYVGTAAMYCDVIVTEKQLADLIRREGFECRAQVLTRLQDLPNALLSIA